MWIDALKPTRVMSTLNVTKQTRRGGVHCAKKGKSLTFKADVTNKSSVQNNAWKQMRAISAQSAVQGRNLIIMGVAKSQRKRRNKKRRKKRRTSQTIAQTGSMASVKVVPRGMFLLKMHHSRLMGVLCLNIVLPYLMVGA